MRSLMFTRAAAQAWLSLLLLAIGASSAAGQAASSTEPARTLDPITPRLYDARDGAGASSAVLVDDEGIVVVDPLNRHFSRWLRAELERRFPGRKITFLVHTSHAYSRAGGGVEYKDSSTIVAREGFVNSLVSVGARLPLELQPLDRNGNNRLEAGELAAPDAQVILEHDVNHDGVVTVGELQDDVATPGKSFRMRETLRVGATSVDLIPVTAASDKDAALALFPSEKLLFVGSGPDLGVTPFTFGTLPPLEVQAWLRAMRTLEFDAVLTGRGRRLTRAEFERTATYVDDLITGVTRAYGKGQTLAQVQAGLTTLHEGEPDAAARPAQVAAVYARLHRIRIDFGGAFLAGSRSGNASLCDGFTSCSAATRSTSVMGRLLIAFDRVGVSVEAGVHGNQLASRESEPLDEAFAYRVSRQSFLLNYHPSKGSRLGVVLGPSILTGDTAGIARVKNTLLPAGGRHDFKAHERHLGFTAGADLAFPVTSGVTIVVPVRASWDTGKPNSRRLGSASVEAGAGLSLMMRQFAR